MPQYVIRAHLVDHEHIAGVLHNLLHKGPDCGAVCAVCCVLYF